MLNFHCYEQPVDELFYVITVESVHTHDQTNKDAPKRTVIRRIFGSAEKVGKKIRRKIRPTLVFPGI